MTAIFRGQGARPLAILGDTIWQHLMRDRGSQQPPGFILISISHQKIRNGMHVEWSIPYVYFFRSNPNTLVQPREKVFEYTSLHLAT